MIASSDEYVFLFGVSRYFMLFEDQQSLWQAGSEVLVIWLNMLTFGFILE